MKFSLFGEQRGGGEWDVSGNKYLFYGFTLIVVILLAVFIPLILTGKVK
jgi:hypothetical protein